MTKPGNVCKKSLAKKGPFSRLRCVRRQIKNGSMKYSSAHRGLFENTKKCSEKEECGRKKGILFRYVWVYDENFRILESINWLESFFCINWIDPLEMNRHLANRLYQFLSRVPHKLGIDHYQFEQNKTIDRHSKRIYDMRPFFRVCLHLKKP